MATELPEGLRTRLTRHGQQHVLRFWDELSDRQRARLVSQLETLDLEQLAKLFAGQDVQPDFAAMAAAAEAPPSVGADGTGPGWTLERAVETGAETLAAGKIGAVIVAGGQGSRLGFDQPKGMYPIGPVSGRTLFQFFADRLVATNRRYGVRVPLYVMTSDATDAETKAYFESNQHLGLPADDVTIFKQGTMPAVDAATGKLLLADKHALALSPDGHGGTVGALDRSGCLDEMRRRGIEHLFYIQVDNPIANLCDPALVGHHVLATSEMTTQVIRKRYPTEKVGNVVAIDNTVHIIEYSDLPESAAQARQSDGALKLWAGNIAVHLFDVAFLCRMRQSVDALPFHRASKRVEFIDDSGGRVQPNQPNAIKFERFIFDLLPQASHAIVVESLPEQAFAPVKNADGAPADTPMLARAAISDLYRSWLERAGAEVDPQVDVEINSRFALDPAELAEKISAKIRIDTDRYFDI